MPVIVSSLTFALALALALALAIKRRYVEAASGSYVPPPGMPDISLFR